MANNPTNTPEMQADLLLDAGVRLLQAGPDALLEAIGDVIEVIEALLSRPETEGSAPARAANKARVKMLVELLRKLHIRLKEMLYQQDLTADEVESNVNKGPKF
jgi:hypothetical protein